MGDGTLSNTSTLPTLASNNGGWYMSGRAIRIDGCTNNVEFFALNNAEISPV